MYLVDAEVAAEDVADEGEDCGEAVPQTIEETVDLARRFERGASHGVCGCAGRQGEHEDGAQGKNQDEFLGFHIFSLRRNRFCAQAWADLELSPY